MNENAFVVPSPMFYGKYAVKYPDGTTETCYNYATCLSIATRYNKTRVGKKKEDKPMNNDRIITDIQGVIDALEDILEDYTNIDERRPIINVIKFCQRQLEGGKELKDIIWWIQRELPKGLDHALNTYTEVQHR
jgi:hypothetical protein